MRKFQRVTTEFQEEQQKPVADQKPMEEIDLPSSIEAELLQDAPRSALQVLKRIFTQAGVTDTQQQKFEEAVLAYLERPTTVTRTVRGLEFRPQEYYFAPLISFGEMPALPAGTLDASLLPRLTKDGVLVRQSLNESLVQRAATAFENPKPEATKNHATTPVERMLTQLNRLMYAFHEPLHILQTLLPGERINQLKETFDAYDLINPVKERDYILHGRQEADFALQPPAGLTASVFPIQDLTGTLQPGEAHSDWSGTIVRHNEATMDVLSELALKEFLRQKPALLLWTHNTFCLLNAVLRRWKEEFEAIPPTDDDENAELVAALEQLLNENPDNTDRLLSKREEAQKTLKTRVGRLEDVCGFLEQIYFSAFDTSDEAVDYFANTALPKTLNRNLAGTIVDTEPFDRASYLNLLGDLRGLSNTELLRPVTYTSGETHWYEEFWNTPLTKEAITLTQQLFERAVQQNRDGKEVLSIVTRLSDAVRKHILLERDKELDNALPVEVVLEEIQTAWQLPWSDQDLQELAGLDKYLIPDFGARYNRQRLLRKALMTDLLKRHPEQVAPLIQSVFFEAPTFFAREDFIRITGFGHVKREPIANNGTMISTDFLTEPAFQQSTDLGIFDLDVTRLPPNEQAELWQMLIQSQADTATASQTFQQETLRWIIEKRRQQVPK